MFLICGFKQSVICTSFKVQAWMFYTSVLCDWFWRTTAVIVPIHTHSDAQNTNFAHEPHHVFIFISLWLLFFRMLCGNRDLYERLQYNTTSAMSLGTFWIFIFICSHNDDFRCARCFQMCKSLGACIWCYNPVKLIGYM